MNQPKKKTEIDNLNTVCFWLIKKCRETNAESMTVTQENVTEHGKSIGSWKIIVKKISK